MKSQDSKLFWNSFSTIFVENMAIKTSQVQLTLLSMLNWKNTQAIFDAGCGCGHLFPYIVQEKSKTTKLIGMDLAPKMIESCAMNLKSKFNMNFDYDQNSESYVFNDLNVKVNIGNVEDLSKFEESSFDVYYSNLTLQLVENPQKMINEAHRVLKENGQIACSVWGRRENNDYHLFVPEIFKEFGIEECKSVRSNFDLNEKETLMNIFEQAQFKDILCWYQQVPFHFQTAQQFIEFMLQRPATSKLVEGWSEEQKGKIVKRMEEEITKKWKVKKEPYYFEALMISGRK